MIKFMKGVVYTVEVDYLLIYIGKFLGYEPVTAYRIFFFFFTTLDIFKVVHHTYIAIYIAIRN